MWRQLANAFHLWVVQMSVAVNVLKRNKDAPLPQLIPAQQVTSNLHLKHVEDTLYKVTTTMTEYILLEYFSVAAGSAKIIP